MPTFFPKKTYLCNKKNMKAELIDYFGDDLRVCDVARVSYDKLASTYTNEQNQKLIKYLASHKHTSPFRHPQLSYRITCPIYVERQLRKHEVGLEVETMENTSVNSISGRYVDFSDSYTKITEWRKQSKSSKQGSEGVVENQQRCIEIENEIIELAKVRYEELIALGVSKEQARSILPLNLNTTFVWTGSLLAFFHLFELRLKPDAQKETRDVVQLMFDQIKNLDGNPFAWSLDAFGF